jgi:hypothetical protein
MDFYTALFWIGFAILIVSHVLMLNGPMQQHALIALGGTFSMFVGSKLGREFLGL